MTAHTSQANGLVSMQTKMIGGMFGFELRTAGNVPRVNGISSILQTPRVRLATARGAFSFLAHALRPTAVWLPSYLCGVVLRAFPAEITKVQFYAVDGHLQVAEETWLGRIQQGDLVVFIDYFGFDLWAEWGLVAKEHGAWVVEDACQGMLNHAFNEHAHYVICSPRKFVGVPDGGVLIAQNEAQLPDHELDAPPVEWWIEALRASVLRAECDRHGGDRTWFPLFQKVEDTGPVEPCRMSELTSLVLDHCVDWDEMARRRRENYAFLASELSDLALFADLPTGTVPLGFPIRLEDRDRVRKSLFKEEIYPPVHWPIAGFVPAEFAASHRLAAEIMTLPCDQRYDFDDMRRMVACLREALGRA